MCTYFDKHAYFYGVQNLKLTAVFFKNILRQTDGWTDKQIDQKINPETARQIDRQADGWVDRFVGKILAVHKQYWPLHRNLANNSFRFNTLLPSKFEYFASTQWYLIFDLPQCTQA